MPRSYIVFEGPRQSGKTHRLIGTILDRAVVRGWTCFVLVPYWTSAKVIMERIRNGIEYPEMIEVFNRREIALRNGGRIIFDCVENHMHTFHGQNIEQISLFMNDCEYKPNAFKEIMETPHYKFREILFTRCTGPDAAKPDERLH